MVADALPWYIICCPSRNLRLLPPFLRRCNGRHQPLAFASTYTLDRAPSSGASRVPTLSPASLAYRARKSRTWPGGAGSGRRRRACDRQLVKGWLPGPTSLPRRLRPQRRDPSLMPTPTPAASHFHPPLM